MSKRKGRPSWIKNAEHKFTNQYGEVWYAKETEEGFILTGNDVLIGKNTQLTLSEPRKFL